MRDLLTSTPLWAICALLLVFFIGVSYSARALIRRRCSGDTCEDLADQASHLLTGLAATFAFFVGFAITVTWGAVSAGQAAVEQQAAAIQQMAWKLNNIPDRAASAALMDKLGTYAATAANADDAFLVRGDTTNLPSLIPLDRFEDALHIYAFGPSAKPQEVNSLVTAAALVGTSSATVAAVAKRTLPGVLAALLLITGVLVAIVMGITTVTTRRPVLFFVWCLIPALSITVVIALAYPFAHRIGVNLAPLQAVASVLNR
ncbi:MAG: hypothetical protein O3B27_12795 [Actinomycetota bacterium]|nr:hypothetical protein [Actinomycetota bacterium]MDA2992420.1 hypothetical protein [Actinomycetota bacterium]